jgi:methyl-accepting chemotaxis protein
VLRGKDLANRSGTAIQRIVDEIGQVTENITQIAAANEEQSGRAEERSRNVENVATVATHAAQGITQIAGATGHVNDLSSRLLVLLGGFSVEAAPKTATTRTTHS